MEVKRECMVMLLPTEKAEIGTIMKSIKLSSLHDDDIDKPIGSLVLNKNYSVTKSNDYWQAQHLYILSSDEIKKGDWYIDDTSTVRKAVTDDKDYWDRRPNYFKIISTTDSSLGLPQPSPQFIQKYVELYNRGEVIERCLVSYKRVCSRCKSDDFDECWSAKECSDGRYDELRLLVDKNNYITITKVKESWSRDETVRLIQRAITLGMQCERDRVDSNEVFLQFIKQNL
jgi:hypothetical protein